MAAAMVLLLPSCSDSNEKVGPEIGERDSLPTLKSIGVSTLISDSGVIRYKIISEDWYIYDKKDPTRQKKLPASNVLHQFQASKNDVAVKILRSLDNEDSDTSELAKKLAEFTK